MSHTPGPWKVSGLGYVVARDPRETLICQPIGAMSNPEVAADMRLIAIAPELYELARAVDEHFADTDAPLGERARALITKAEA